MCNVGVSKYIRSKLRLDEYFAFFIIINPVFLVIINNPVFIWSSFIVEEEGGPETSPGSITCGGEGEKQISHESFMVGV